MIAAIRRWISEPGPMKFPESAYVTELLRRESTANKWRADDRAMRPRELIAAIEIYAVARSHRVLAEDSETDQPHFMLDDTDYFCANEDRARANVISLLDRYTEPKP